MVRSYVGFENASKSVCWIGKDSKAIPLGVGSDLDKKISLVAGPQYAQTRVKEVLG